MEEERLNAILQALAHPTRRCIVRVLGEKGAAGYAELMKACGVPDSGTLAFHMRRLRGLVEKGDDGLYRLTSDGVEAYRVLQAFTSGSDSRGGEGREQRSGGCCEERGGGERLIHYSDRVYLRLTREHLENARRKGARILITDITKLIIDPVPVDLFDETVEGIMDVMLVYAPRSLKPVLDEKMVDVVKVRYYDESVGASDEAVVEEEVVTPMVGSVASAAVRMAAGLSGLLASIFSRIGSLLELGGREAREYSVRGRVGDRLSLELQACDVVVEGVDGDVLEASGRASRVELRGSTLVVEGGGGACKVRVLVPRVVRVLEVEGNAVRLHGGIGKVRELILEASASAVDLKAGFEGDARLKVDASASKTRLRVDAVGVDRLEASLSANSSLLEATIDAPGEASVYVEPEGLGEVVVRVDGVEWVGSRPVRVEGGGPEVRVAVDVRGGIARIDVRRRGG